MNMKYSEYNQSKGMLIDVEESNVFKKKHLYEAINIPFEKLIANYKKLLDKNKTYFIYCRKGQRSKKAVQILKFYGYNVTQIVNE